MTRVQQRYFRIQSPPIFDGDTLVVVARAENGCLYTIIVTLDTGGVQAGRVLQHWLTDEAIDRNGLGACSIRKRAA